jgi:hypothetical protein
MWFHGDTKTGPKPDIAAQLAEGQYHSILAGLSLRGALMASVSHSALIVAEAV